MADERANPQAHDAAFAVSRRSALGAVSLGVAATTAGPAVAVVGSVAGTGLREFSGHFPVTPGHEIDGLFVAPVGGRGLDVVVLTAGPEVSAPRIAETARRLAGQGCFAVAPVLPDDAAQRDVAIAGMTPALARMAHTSGRVRIVAI